MKTTLKFLMPLVLGLGCLHAQTIEWGSEFGTVFETSEGNSLDSSFVFELGAFDNLFAPTPSNVDDWFANWRVFDTGDYTPALGYVTSSASMITTASLGPPVQVVGGSNSPTGDAAFNFQGLQAYVWIRNEDSPSPTSEWFLDVDPAWIFPNVNPDCCGNDLPLQWVMDNPIVTIPEPSGVMLFTLAAAAGLLRRRR